MKSAHSVLNVPVNDSMCFSTHENNYDERVKHQKVKMLKKLETMLQRILTPDEKIVYAAKAHSPISIGELLLSGWLIFLMKQCVLVFTNKRILYIPVKISSWPRGSISQILYGDIKEYKTGGVFNQNLTLVYKTNKQEQYNYISLNDRKKISALLQQFVPTGHSTEEKQIHNLCPRCTASLQKDNYVCPNCRFAFKNMQKAIRYALLLPGGGFFYTRHFFIGTYYAFAEGIFLILLVAFILGAFGDSTDFGAAFSIIILLSLIKLIHIFHTRRYVKEYIPVDKDQISLHSSS